MNNQDIYIKVSSNDEKKEVRNLLLKSGARPGRTTYLPTAGIIRVFMGEVFVYDLPALPNAKEVNKEEIKNYNWNENGKA